MKNSLFPLLLAVSAGAHPFTGRAIADLQRLAALSTRSTSLIGDLVGSDQNLTAAGDDISGILTGRVTAVADPAATYTAPDVQDSQKCKADTCCTWSHIVSDMQSSFVSGGTCTSLAREAIRLGFHDSAAWESSLSYGGADGSVVLNSQESVRPENKGLEDIIAQMHTWYNKYKQYGAGMADLIQMGATTAVVCCPGGPRIKSYVGRKDSSQLPPEGLIPSPFGDAQTNIKLFEAKTFSASDLVALVGAHTVSRQFFVDTTKAGEPQDTTDAVWDTKFYSDTLSRTAPDGVFRFQSDLSLANNSETSGTWKAFSQDLDAWNTVS